MYNTCLDNIICTYSNLEKYPLLNLYITDPITFFTEYLIIEEVDIVSICKKDNSQIIIIEKSSFIYSDLPLYKKNKKEKVKLFSLGNIEVYKKDIHL